MSSCVLRAEERIQQLSDDKRAVEKEVSVHLISFTLCFQTSSPTFSIVSRTSIVEF